VSEKTRRPGGRRRFEPLLTFKALILQSGMAWTLTLRQWLAA